MNNVSLLFYLSDVITNLRVPLAFLAILSFFLAVAPFVASLFGETEDIKFWYKINEDRTRERISISEYEKLPQREKDYEYEKMFVKWYPKARLWAWVTIPLFVVLTTIANALPSRDTIFMIATSEFVEDFSTTEMGTEIGSLANETLDYLKSELKKLKGE